MILARPEIIIPRGQGGYARYGNPASPFPFVIGQGVVDRNFTWPDGRPGLISGMVAKVPAGTCLEPFKFTGGDAGYNEFNSTIIEHYVAPTQLSWVRSFGNTSAQKFEHNGVLIGISGERVDLWNGQDDQLYGTFCNIALVPWIPDFFNGVNRFRFGLFCSTQLGAVLSCFEYESGVDGICNFKILSGNPYAVTARRVSDETRQVLTAGGLNIPAGISVVTCEVTWSSGTNAPAGMTARIRVDVAIPYGI